MAELWALRDGFSLAKAENVRKLEIEVDALGVVQLLNEQTKNHPMGNILLDCRSLMVELEAVSIKHVHREANYCADALANDALISVGDLYIYPCFPNCISNLFYADLIGGCKPLACKLYLVV